MSSKIATLAPAGNEGQARHAHGRELAPGWEAPYSARPRVDERPAGAGRREETHVRDHPLPRLRAPESAREHALRVVSLSPDRSRGAGGGRPRSAAGAARAPP